MPASYPISAAAKLTGIPLDTLRAWERRYRAVTPSRSSRGRIYSENEINRLQLLRQTVALGHAIGQIATRTDRQLRDLLEKSSGFGAGNAAPEEKKSQDILAPVLNALQGFDSAATDREINRLAAAIASPRQFVHEVALPLMHIVGQRWHEGKCSIAQEHLLTRHLSAVLISFLRTYSPARPPVRVLLATPRDERHEFPTLAAALLTAASGLGIVYLGADLPAADIVMAARRTDVHVVLLSLSYAASRGTVEELNFVARKLPRSTALWLGGPASLHLERSTAGSRWLVLHDFAALEHQLAAKGGRF